MNSFLKRLLDFLKLDDGAFLSRTTSGKDIDEVLSITRLPEKGAICSSSTDFKKAVEFLKDTVKEDSPTVIYGDYDVDGLTSTSIMAMTLRLLGVPKVGFFIPSRYDNGYGLSLPVLKKMVEAGYQRLIAVDNGITKKEEIRSLVDRGLKVLVLDHHEEQRLSLPPFDGTKALMYHRNDVSAACIALLVCQRLLEEETRPIKDKEAYLRYFFTLASLAVFSDCMSLTNPHNLALAKIGLNDLNEGYEDPSDPCHPLYWNLVRLTNHTEPSVPLDYKDINFSINSKLNALARMKGGNYPNLGGFYLQGKTRHKDIDILSFLEEVSTAKRNLVNRIKNENKPVEMGGFYVVDLSSEEGVPSGLSGLLANSLLDKYHLKKPVLVLCASSLNEDDMIASFRSVKGYALDKIIDSPSIRPLLKDHGGHAQACGFTLEKKNKAALYKALKEVFSTSKPKEGKERYIPVEVEELGEEIFDAYDLLEPFGQDFEKPLLGTILPKATLLASSRGEHIFLPLAKGEQGENRKIIYFQGVNPLNEIKGEKVLVKGEMEEEIFKGNRTYVFHIKECDEAE